VGNIVVTVGNSVVTVGNNDVNSRFSTQLTQQIEQNPNKTLDNP
jgi:hypothetical protein